MSRDTPQSLVQGQRQSFAQRIWGGPTRTDFQSGSSATNVVRMVRVVRLSTFGSHPSTGEAKDVRDDVPILRDLSLCLHFERDLNVGKRFRVGVLVGIFSETLRVEGLSTAWKESWEEILAYLVDDEMVNRNLSSPNGFSEGGEILVNLLDDGFRCIPRKNLIQDVSEGAVARISNPKPGKQWIRKGTENPYLEADLDNSQNSLLFISNPLISVDFVPFSSILTAAYFFLLRSNMRSKTASVSISSRLYLSLMSFLKSSPILIAAA